METVAAVTKRPKQPEDVRMSKALSYLLRHGAEKAGLALRPDGFARVADVLKTGSLGRSATMQDVQNVVRNCEKQRFALAEFEGELWIRANQGHTIKSIDRELAYKRIEDASEYPVCIHGTTRKAWEDIKLSGLCRMRRNEIHCAKGEFGEVKSGFRATAQVLIHIDMARCLEDGIPWFESDNGVLLTPGVGPKGMIPTGYFLKAVDSKTQKVLPFEKRFDLPETTE